MQVQCVIREVGTRIIRASGSNPERSVPVLTIETGSPIALLSVEVRREHEAQVETYRNLVGKPVLLAVAPDLVAPQGDKRFSPFLKWNTSGDGKAVNVTVRAAA
jgi:hypothetical protein